MTGTKRGDVLSNLADPEIEEPALPVDSTQRRLGSLDEVSAARIAGWAWDPRRPNEAELIDVYDGDQLVLSIRADGYRKDLKDAGIGTGHHGFSIPHVGALFPLSRHRVAVRRAGDGTDLARSPVWLDQPFVGIDPAAGQFMELVTDAAVNSARSPDELDPHISLMLRMLNQTINARHALAEERQFAPESPLQDFLHSAELSDWTRELLTKVQRDYLPIQFESSESPLVSVVIPVFNKFRTTYDCLKSISDHLPKGSFEIILVDDCSTDETLFASFVFSGGIQFVRNAKNQGFVRTCNAGARAAKGKYLFFLNNDTLVRPGWLDELAATFDSVPNVGIVGSKLLFENGQLQEVGGIIWRLGDGWNWGREADPTEPRFCYLRDSDYVSGAALMIERGLFDKLGGFDELFVPAYYEDTDLCFRVRAAGYRTVVQPASEIVHLEGVSAGKDVMGTGMKRYQRINHRKFYERWKGTLAAHRFNAEQPELEAERSVKRRALFIDDSVPTPDQDAGSNAALQHMLSLMRLGYKVTFLPADNMARIDPYTRNLQKLGIECLYAPFYWSVEEVFRKTKVKPDVVYLHRYSNASKYANMVRQHFPTCTTLYNVADLHFLRQKRELEIEGSLGNVAAITEDAEISVMRQVDSIIVHSSTEAAILREKAPSLNVTVVPWTIIPRPTPIPFAKRSGFAFVGGYGHRPNVDAALYLAKDIMPALQRLNPTIQGFLAGSKPPPEIVALESANLRVLGFVPDLAGLLHRLRCTVAPLRYGAGMKGKVLESFAHGLPCVMSPVAAEGLDLPLALKWLIVETPEEFSQKVGSLHTDVDLNSDLAEQGLRFIGERFGREAIDPLMGTSICKQ